MNRDYTSAARLDRRLEESRAALIRTVGRAVLAATVLFLTACAAPALHTGSYERSAAEDAEPMYRRYAPARLLTQAAALELAPAQVAALSAIRDSAVGGRLSELDAAQSARGVLSPTQRRVVEADPRVRSRAPASAPPPRPHHEE